MGGCAWTESNIRVIVPIRLFNRYSTAVQPCSLMAAKVLGAASFPTRPLTASKVFLEALDHSRQDLYSKGILWRGGQICNSRGVVRHGLIFPENCYP